MAALAGLCPTLRPELVERLGGISFGCVPPAPSVAGRADLLFGIAQKVGKKASPCTPLLPPVLAGGMRQRRTLASLALRTVCADDASTTARCCAPRRGLKGQLVRNQLFSESLITYELRCVKRHLSIYGLLVLACLINGRFSEKLHVARMRASGLRGWR
jgi:hypothetical protein